MTRQDTKWAQTFAEVEGLLNNDFVVEAAKKLAAMPREAWRTWEWDSMADACHRLEGVMVEEWTPERLKADRKRKGRK